MKKLLTALVLCMGTSVMAQQQQQQPQQQQPRQQQQQQEGRDIGTGIEATEVLPGLSGATQPGEQPDAIFQKRAQAFNIQGTIRSSERDGVTLSRQGLPNAELKVNPRTVVMLDGKRVASPDALPEGAQVRAMFNLVEGDAVAVELQAKSPKQQRGGQQQQQQKQQRQPQRQQ